MWIKKARAALSHPAFTGISRNHLDRLVAELADPFAAAREGRLHQRRGGRQRHRWPGAGHPETLTLRDRLLCTLVWLRLALPHQAIAVLYGVERSMVSKAIAQMRPLLANRGFATKPLARPNPHSESPSNTPSHRSNGGEPCSASPATANSYPTSSAPSPAWPATTPPPDETGPRATPIDPKVVSTVRMRPSRLQGTIRG